MNVKFIHLYIRFRAASTCITNELLQDMCIKYKKESLIEEIKLCKGVT